MPRAEKSRILAKMSKVETPVQPRQEIDAKMKKLVQTISSAFQEHFSMTRTKTIAQWQERNMPGANVSSLYSVCSVTIHFIIIFHSNALQTLPQLVRD